MIRRFLVGTAMVSMMNATPAFAADTPATTAVTPVEIAVTAARLDTAAAVAAATASWPRRPEAIHDLVFNPYRRPSALPALYAGHIALQAYDSYSTIAALKAGAREANPLMKVAAKNPLAFIALKSGATMLSIAAAERLWKEGHRVAAVVSMAISNTVMVLVAANNASVLSRIR